MPKARKRPCTNLPPVVASRSTSETATSLRSAGVSDGAPAEAAPLAAPQSGLRHRLGLDRRKAQVQPSEPLRLPPPLPRLPGTSQKTSSARKALIFWDLSALILRKTSSGLIRLLHTAREPIEPIEIIADRHGQS